MGNTNGSDQTIDSFPNCEATLTTVPINHRGLFENGQTIHAKDGILQKKRSCSLVFGVFVDALKNFAENEIGQREGPIFHNQLLEVMVLRGPGSIKKIYPDSRINNDHTRDLRITFRLPSHFTLPRSCRISFRFSFLNNS